VRTGSFAVELNPGFCADTLARALVVLAQAGRQC